MMISKSISLKHRSLRSMQFKALIFKVKSTFDVNVQNDLNKLSESQQNTGEVKQVFIFSMFSMAFI